MEGLKYELWKRRNEKEVQSIFMEWCQPKEHPWPQSSWAPWSLCFPELLSPTAKDSWGTVRSHDGQMRWERDQSGLGSGIAHSNNEAIFFIRLASPERWQDLEDLKVHLPTPTATGSTGCYGLCGQVFWPCLPSIDIHSSLFLGQGVA